VKMFRFLAGFMGSVFFAISATTSAAPHGGGFRGGGFHGHFIGRNAGPAFTMGRGVRRDFTFRQSRFLHRRDHPFFVQQVIWPVYWAPYYGLGYYPWDTSYLDYGPDDDYDYGSTAPVQPEYSRRTTSPEPLVVVINQGNSRSTDNPNAGYPNNIYGSTAVQDKPRMAAQGSSEEAGTRTDPLKFVSPAATQAGQAAVQAHQAVLEPRAWGSRKLVLVSWLNDNGKDVIYVQNVETNDVQRITSEPNRENFRIVEVHPNADPKEFEAIISNGSKQISVGFRF
jgi:hypothetical protein